MPIDADGNITPFLTATDQQKLAERRAENGVREALSKLGEHADLQLSATDPLVRAQALVTSMYRTADNLLPSFNAVRQYQDANLVPDAQEAERGQKLAALQAALNRRGEGLAKRSAEALAEADAEASKYRPQLKPDDVAQAMRTDQAWNNSIKPQLDAGKDWGQIMNSLDADGLLAVQRFAPSHESAKRDRFTQHEVPSVLAGIQRMSERRLIDIAPEGEAKNALAAHAKVQKIHETVAAAASSLQGLGNVAGIPRNEVVLNAQGGIKHAAFDAGAQLGTTTEG